MKKDVKIYTKKDRIIFISTIVFIFLISLFLLIYGISLKNKKINDTILYSYNITKKLDYKVNLYDNSFIDEKTLDKGNTYISDLVKSIEANFMYNISSSAKSNYNYKYSVTATIQGNYQSSSSESKNSVWNKNYVLVEEKNIKKEDISNLNINEKVTIDYNYYNNEVLEFRKKLKLPITANLIVKLNVYTANDMEKANKLVDESSIEMIIPLNTQAFKIEEKYEKNTSNTVFDKNVKNYTIYFITFAFIALVLDVIIFILYYKKIFNIDEKSKYKTTVSKILKKYGDVVVEIVKPVNTKIKTVIDVKNFDAMLDLESELRSPILFHEISNKSEGWFTLIHNETLYRYILKDEKKKEDKNDM